jgi:tetratricopeptide (TPR) repeat protein
MTARFARLLACALTIAVGAGLWSAPSAAAAAPDPTAQAEELGGEARDAYRAGRYSRAIELYLEAYETAATAGFLFNIAYIYDNKTGDKALARDYYERAARFEGADPDLVAKARARAAEITAALARRPDAPPDKVPDAPPGKAPDTPPDKIPDTPPDKIPDVVGGGSPDVLPWIVIGTGAAILGTGIALGVVASGTERDFHAATDNDTRRSLQTTGQGQALGADVLMVVGIGAVGTGLVLWLLGEDEPADRGSVHVTPALLEGGAGVVLGGAL